MRWLLLLLSLPAFAQFTPPSGGGSGCGNPNCTVSGNLNVSGITTIGPTVLTQTGGVTNLNSVVVTALVNPTSPVVTPTCAGTCATQYSYRVVAYAPDGTHTARSGNGTTLLQAATANSTNYNTVVLPAIANSARCDVYRTAGMTLGKLTGSGGVACGSTLIDNGLAGDGTSSASISFNNTGAVTPADVETKSQSGILYAANWCTTPGTLDETCINNALLAFGAAPNCGVVVLPQGDLTIANTIGGSNIDGRRGCFLSGTGSGNGASTGTRLHWTGSANGTVVQVKGCYQCRAADFAIDGSSTAGIGLDVTVGASTTQNNNYSNIRIDNVTGTPGKGVHIGDPSNGQVDTTRFDSIVMNTVNTGFYQDGVNTLQINYRDCVITGYATAGLDADGGDFVASNLQFASATTGGTATYIVSNAITQAVILGGEVETSTNVPCFSMPGISSAAGHTVTIVGHTCTTSSSALQVLNYTQNGTLNLLGDTWAGTAATMSFAPIGGSGLTGQINAVGNIVGGVTPSGASIGAGTVASTYATASNCSSSASPAVCGVSAAGSAVVAAAATMVVINTSAVTANSQIIVAEDESLGTKLSVTCNTQSQLVLGAPRVIARTAGTSFTVGVDVAPTANPLCLSYSIVN